MKAFVVLAILGLAGVTYGYTTQHDDLDIEGIASNKESLQAFLDCFTDKKPCNELTQSFKINMPPVIREACADCSPIQKLKLKQFLDGLNEKLPGGYAEFKKQIDPEGKFFVALDAALSKA